MFLFKALHLTDHMLRQVLPNCVYDSSWCPFEAIRQLMNHCITINHPHLIAHHITFTHKRQALLGIEIAP